MKTLIFDLDGTLIDTARLVYPAFREGLRHFPEFPVPSESVMASTFGLPDHRIWEVLMPDASPAQRLQASGISDDAIEQGLFKTDVMFENARTVLETLSQRGYTLTVASNCGTQYLNAILESQALHELFSYPLCLQSVNGRVKTDILTAHFTRFHKTGAWMIGDRSSDVEAAAAHGIPTIGCILGTNFGDASELANAKHIIHHLNELLTLFPG